MSKKVRKIKILFVEDQSRDVELVLNELSKSGIYPEYKVVASEDDFKMAIKEPIDLILCDHNLPTFNSIQAVKILRDKELDIPLIVVSGDMNEELVVKILELGADDHLYKDRLGRIGAAVIGALNQKQIREDYKRVIEQKSAILDASLDAIISIDHKGNILQWNKAAENIFKYKSSDVLGKPLAQTIIPERLREQHISGMKKYLQSGQSKLLEKKSQMPALRADGKEIQIEIFIKATKHLEQPSIFTASAKDLGQQLHAEDLIRKNEARLNQVIEAAPNGLVMVDKLGKIVLCNAQIESMFNYTKKELIGKSIETLVPLNFRKKHPAYRDAYFRSPETRQMGSGRDLYGLRKDGSEIPVEIGLNPLRTENGVFVLASIVDITERKVNEDKIKQERDKVVTVLDLNTDGWWEWNLKNLEDEYYSPGFKKLFGYEDHELENKSKTWKKLIFPEDLETAIENFNKHLESDGMHPYYQKSRYKHKNGSTVWVVCKGVAIKDRNGKWDRMIGVHFDITNLMELEQNLIETNKELEKKNEEMEQFIYTVSHDLKSPLVTSIGFLGYMEKDILEQNYGKLNDSMARLKKANARMEQLIDDLLRLSRIGRISLISGQVDCNQLVRNLLDNLKVRIEEKKAVIKKESDLPILTADKERIYQVLENLIINALKYGCKTENCKIIIGSKTNENSHLIFVKDFGRGIDPEYHKKIFDLFQRLEGSDKEGTGVGLTIVARIMQLHGGRVWVESQIGKGATFWLEFPKKFQGDRGE